MSASIKDRVMSAISRVLATAICAWLLFGISLSEGRTLPVLLAPNNTPAAVKEILKKNEHCSRLNIDRVINRDGFLNCISDIAVGEEALYFNQPISMSVVCQGQVSRLDEGAESNVLVKFGRRSADIAFRVLSVSEMLPSAIAIRGLVINQKQASLTRGENTYVGFNFNGKPWKHRLSKPRRIDALVAFTQVHYLRKSKVLNTSKKLSFDKLYLHLTAMHGKCKIEIFVGDTDDTESSLPT